MDGAPMDGGDPNGADPPVKRGRGRPRKYPIGTTALPKTSSDPPKKRGRPRKSEPTEPVVKRPRGRPRKSLPVAPVSQISDSEKSASERALEPGEAVAKLPRGRPSKSLLTAAILDDSQLESNDEEVDVKPIETVAKRGRGRPKKASLAAPIMSRSETAGTSNTMDFDSQLRTQVENDIQGAKTAAACELQGDANHLEEEDGESMVEDDESVDQEPLTYAELEKAYKKLWQQHQDLKTKFAELTLTASKGEALKDAR